MNKVKKQTRRDLFLGELERAVPWRELEDLAAPHYPQGEISGLPRMLKAHTVQKCFGLSDEGVEDAIYDSRAIQEFVGIDPDCKSAPDAAAVRRFRQLLEKQNLAETLFEKIRKHLGAKGLLLREGTIVDAALIRDHDRSARKVYIYGAGDYGTATVFHLRVQGIEPKAFIDENANRVELKTGLTVLKPSDVLCEKTKPYVIIADINATTIEKMIAVLELYGLKNREDFELSVFVQFHYDPHQFIFVIYTPAYDFTIGDTALFQLHELLIKHDFNSKICVWGTEKALPPLTGRGTVVIYPEAVNGNPLNARNIVRWLPYKPKVHNPDANFTQNELTFCYDKMFNDINLKEKEVDGQVLNFVDICRKKFGISEEMGDQGSADCRLSDAG